jgi:hypothetical protein
MLRTKVLNAPAILRAIRDEKANDVDSLAAYFANRSPGWVGSRVVGDTPRSVLARAIEHYLSDLTRVKAVVVDENHRITFNEEWYDWPVLPIQKSGLAALDELAQPGSAVVHPSFAQHDVEQGGSDVFVMMSFDPANSSVYKTIKETAAPLGVTVRRGDDLFTAHAVMHDIWTQIMKARAVVADCTGRNANVFYEIGIAHTIGKPVVLITQRATDVPFDLRSFRFIRYTLTEAGLRRLRSALKATLADSLGLPQTT